MTLRALIWDVDGTLAETERDGLSGVDAVLRTGEKGCDHAGSSS